MFAGPIVEGSRRKKIPQKEAGTEVLFGKDKCDFGNTSNGVSLLGKKSFGKQWTPVRKEKTAEQRKNDELYGRTIADHGMGKKCDGTLMASQADWRNLH